MIKFITVLERAISTLPENSIESRLDVYGKARQTAFRAFEEFKIPLETRMRQMATLEEAISAVEAQQRNRAREGRGRRSA
jgi:hypothetical protein